MKIIFAMNKECYIVIEKCRKSQQINIFINSPYIVLAKDNFDIYTGAINCAPTTFLFTLNPTWFSALRLCAVLKIRRRRMANYFYRRAALPLILKLQIASAAGAFCYFLIFVVHERILTDIAMGNNLALRLGLLCFMRILHIKPADKNNYKRKRNHDKEKGGDINIYHGILRRLIRPRILPGTASVFLKAL